MKKIIAVFIAALMMLSLFACNNGNSSTSDSSANTQNTDAAPPASSASGDSQPAASGSVGWITDEVDHFARPTYKIAYIVAFYVAVNATLSDQLKLWAEKLNFEYTLVDAQQDNDSFMNSLETLAGQGYDGFILDFNPEATERCYELCQELGVNWISGVNPVVVDDKQLWPGVTLDSFSMGQLMSQWLYDNYSSYWGDVDINDIGMIVCDNSGPIDLHLRCLGSEDRFRELFPDTYATNMFNADMAGLDFAPQSGYDRFTAIKSANPQIKYWLVTSVADLYALGVVRAAEALGAENETLILCADGYSLISEWESGYNGDCFTGAAYIAPVYHTEPIVCGLIAMIDGRVTPENLWPEWKAPGQDYADLQLELTVITRHNYNEYKATAEAYWDSIK